VMRELPVLPSAALTRSRGWLRCSVVREPFRI
jgi:hypothetical protein